MRRLPSLLFCALLASCNSSEPAVTSTPRPSASATLSASAPLPSATPLATPKAHATPGWKSSQPKTGISVEGDGGPDQGKKAQMVESKREPLSKKADSRLVQAVLGHDKVLSESSQKKALIFGLEILLEQGRYDELEAILERYRAHHDSYPDGVRKLTTLYYSMKVPRRGQEGWLPRRLQLWMKERPNSVLPKVAMARLLMDVASGQVTHGESQIEGEFGSYLENPLFFARQFLEEAAALSPDSCIYGYMLELAGLEKAPQEEAERYLQLGEQLDPSDYQPEAEYARYLHQTGKNWRDAVSRKEVVQYITGTYLPGVKLRPKDELEFLQASYKLHPKSTSVMNRMAQAAMKARDYEVAARMFSQLGDRVEVFVWRPIEFYEQRNRLEKLGYKVKKDAFPPLPSVPAEVADLDLDPDLLLTHVCELFTGERYAELDAICDTFRQNHSKFADGTLKMAEVNAIFSNSHLTDLKPWQCSVLFQRWKRQHPHSSTAAAGSVGVCVQEAWDVRGGGYADSVSKRQWDGFRERLEKASAYLAEAEASGANKDPELYANSITMAMGLSQDRDVPDAYLAKARALEPEYVRPFQAMAQYLLPRWHGSDEELADYLKGLPPGMFARVVSNMDDDDVPLSPDDRRQRVSRAVAETARKRDNVSAWTMLLINAFTSRDRASAMEALSHLNGRWSPTWMPDRATYKKIVAWAKGGPYPELSR